jgi:hypothetical protein
VILMDLRQWGGISRFGHVQNSEYHSDMLQTVRIAPALAMPHDALEAAIAVLSHAAAIPQSSSHTKAKHSPPCAALASKG